MDLCYMPPRMLSSGEDASAVGARMFVVSSFLDHFSDQNQAFPG
jgi:hypothetical protein